MQIFIIVAAVILVIVLQLLLQHRQTGRLVCDVYADTDHAEPDEQFNIVIRIENPSLVIFPFVRFRVLIPDDMTVHSDVRAVNHPPSSVEVSGSTVLWPRRVFERRITVSAPKRGNHRFGSFSIETGDFLGFKEYRKEFIRFNSVAIFPRPVPGVNIEETLGSILGDYSVRRYLFEDPVLISGFREYTGREPMRSISWLQSAKTGRLMVKKYDFTSEMSVSVLLDSEGDREIQEICFSLARSVCDILEDKKTEYDFYLNSTIGGANCRQHYFSKGLGSGQRTGILKQLAMAVDTCDFSGEELIGRVQKSSMSTPGVIFISAHRDSGKEKMLAKLAEGGQTSVSAIYAEDYLNENAGGEASPDRLEGEAV